MDPTKFYILDNRTRLRVDKGFWIGTMLWTLLSSILWIIGPGLRVDNGFWKGLCYGPY